MSNTNTNSVEFDVVPCTDAPETPLETMEATEMMEAPKAEAPASKKSKKKKAPYRIFSLILIALSAAALFLPVQILKGFNPENATLFASVTDLFAGGETSMLFDMLPVYTDATNVAGMFAGIVFYALLIAIALTVVFSLLALISGKACLFRTAAFFFVTGFGAYAICGYTLPKFESTAIGLDLITLELAGVGAFLYLVLSFAKKGGKAFASIFQLLFSLVFATATVMAFKDFAPEITKTVEGFGLTFNLTAQIVFAIIWVMTLLGTVRLLTKKGLGLDLVRYLIQLLIAALLCYVAHTAGAGETNLLWKYTVAALAVTLLQLLVCNAQYHLGKPKKETEEEADPVEQPAPAPIPEYTVEEYAEALPYEGGPVEGVEIAQEVNPTFEENPIEPVQVNTAGYDFYNSKSFDPFIAVLNNEERNQFTELFILKYKGVMPEIPDYQVGGDNKEFFRKLFIYLGQYRDRIPDGLLAKIYQFAIRNS